MFPAISTYNVVLYGECRIARGEATYREWRLPDEFGDPGKLVRRDFLYVIIDGTKHPEPCAIIHGKRMAIHDAQLAKQPCWEIED